MERKHYKGHGLQYGVADLYCSLCKFGNVLYTLGILEKVSCLKYTDEG